MEFGVHLPQMTWSGEEPASLAALTRIADPADRLEFAWLTSNDHLVYARPWLDGPVALASVLQASDAAVSGSNKESGIEPAGFPNAVATMFMHVTEDRPPRSAS